MPRLSALLLATALACRTPTAVPTPDLDQEFDLRVGQRASFAAEGFSIRFPGVANDSRCPSDELIACVWEGDAAVLLDLTPAAGAARADTVHTTLEPKAVAFGAYTIRLVRLEPYPETTDPVPASRYVATLLVTRNP